jgi:hypothetical protein
MLIQMWKGSLRMKTMWNTANTGLSPQDWCQLAPVPLWATGRTDSCRPPPPSWSTPLLDPPPADSPARDRRDNAARRQTVFASPQVAPRSGPRPRYLFLPAGQPECDVIFPAVRIIDILIYSIVDPVWPLLQWRKSSSTITLVRILQSRILYLCYHVQ